jgi:hypothetical protein
MSRLIGELTTSYNGRSNTQIATETERLAAQYLRVFTAKPYTL